MSLSPHKKIQGNSVVNCTEIKFYSFSSHKVKLNFLHSLLYFPSVVVSAFFFLKCSSSHSVNLQLNKYLFILINIVQFWLWLNWKDVLSIYNLFWRYKVRREKLILPLLPKEQNMVRQLGWVMGSLASAFFFSPLEEHYNFAAYFYFNLLSFSVSLNYFNCLDINSSSSLKLMDLRRIWRDIVYR